MPAARRSSFLGGLYLAQIARACRIPDHELRATVLRNVARDSQAQEMASVPQVSPVLAAARSGTCPSDSTASAVADDAWLALGVHLETWRIALEEGADASDDPGRAEGLLRMLRTVPAGAAAEGAANRIAKQTRMAAVDRRELEADVADLIDLLCL